MRVDAARDPSKDPKPGDVVLIQDGWTRTVKERNGNSVVFDGSVDGEIYRDCELSLDAWRQGAETAKKVLHVSQ